MKQSDKKWYIWTHHFLHVLEIMVIVLIVLASAFSWRLSLKPYEANWVGHAISGQLGSLFSKSEGVKVSIQKTDFEWVGFRKGALNPLEISLTDFRLTDSAKHIRLIIPKAHFSFVLSDFLTGHLNLTALQITAPVLFVSLPAKERAEPEKNNRFDSEALQEKAEAFLAGKPLLTVQPQQLEKFFGTLKSIKLNDGKIELEQPLDNFGIKKQPHLRVWTVNASFSAKAEDKDWQIRTDIQSERGQIPALNLQLQADKKGHLIQIGVKIPPFYPDHLSEFVQAPFLSALRFKAALQADLQVTDKLRLISSKIILKAGSGQVRLLKSDLPLRRAKIILTATPGDLALNPFEITLAPPVGLPSHVQGKMNFILSGPHRGLEVYTHIDHVYLKNWQYLWPVGAAPKVRPWLMKNMLAGSVADAGLYLAIAPKKDGDWGVTDFNGTALAEQINLRWAKGAPILYGLSGRIDFLNPATLKFTLTSGRQSGLSLVNGGMYLTHMVGKPHARFVITAGLKGSLQDALHFLRILPFKQKIPVPEIFQKATASLEANAKFLIVLHQPINLHTLHLEVKAHVTGLQILHVFKGQDLKNGDLHLNVTSKNLSYTGHIRAAAIPLTVKGVFVFNRRNEAVPIAEVTGDPSVAEIAQSGLSPGQMMQGHLPLKIKIYLQQNLVKVGLRADLTPVAVNFPVLIYKKTAGEKAALDLEIDLTDGKLSAIPVLQITGPALTIAGSGRLLNSGLFKLSFSDLAVGQTALQGNLLLPLEGAKQPSEFTVLSLTGPALYLSPFATGPTEAKSVAKSRGISSKKAAAKASAEIPAGRLQKENYILKADIDRVVFVSEAKTKALEIGNRDKTELQKMHLSVVWQDGPQKVIFRAKIPEKNGRFSENDFISFKLEPAPSEITGPAGHVHKTEIRRFSGTISSLGDLLRATGFYRKLSGGPTTLNGTLSFPEADPENLSVQGLVSTGSFSIYQGEIFGRILQAVSLYGLATVLQEKGLTFSHLSIPFSWENGVVTLNNALVSSPSTGINLSGTVNLTKKYYNLEGTVIPFYFLNSLLSRIPFIWRIFSFRKGGGLFALPYSISGPFNAPEFGVNPVAFFMPGFLRRVAVLTTNQILQN